MMLEIGQAKSLIEGLLFVSGDEGIEVKQLVEILEMEAKDILCLLHDMQEEYRQQHRGLQIVEVAQAFQLTTLPEHAPYFERLASSPTHSTLSQAALETLAIIAYKQPITLAEVEEIRGVKSERAINTLSNKRLIQEIGRVEGSGRPILYGTTREFLEYFGLKNVQDLPPAPQFPIDDEIKKQAELLFRRS